MTLIGDAVAAKRVSCPRCGVRENTGCREDDRQILPLEDTHQERLELAVPGTTSRSGVRDAEG